MKSNDDMPPTKETSDQNDQGDNKKYFTANTFSFPPHSKPGNKSP